MGRIGDGDVHAAYVEFRAKESDKVRSHVPQYSPSLLPSSYLLAANCASCHVTQTNVLSYYMVNTDKCLQVSLRAMHLLPIRARQKYLTPTPAPTRVSQLPGRYEGAQP